MCLAIPGKVLSVEEGVGRMAKVQFGGIVRTASLDLVPEAGVGDYVLVHVGFAISKIDEEEARKTMEALEQLADLQDELGPDPVGRA
ncbi:MAG TPA: HypC/HybG/HupF family hydrogenase formation chaperone [Terriglobales bacterium]|nr:HypC/HybG/HupF family hydrogenase formation chaperone [Terriglobales bacterium]